MTHKKDSRGFTLMEMVVVLAVIAILAAILTPIINSYVERARLNSARSDVKNIAAAFVQFNTDAKFWPIYKTAADAPNNANATLNVWDFMGSEGNNATLTGAGWSALSTTTGALSDFLNTNFYGLNAAPVTGGGPSQPVYRGPYLELGPDPWGSRYYVTSKWLKPGSNQDKAAFVVSPGPNATIDTAYDQSRTGSTAFVISSDDIVARIR